MENSVSLNGLIQTTEDRAMILEDISLLAKIANENGFEKATDSVRKPLREIIGKNSLSSLEEINLLKKKIESLVVVSMTLSVEPRRSLITKIYEWFTRNVREDIIIEFHIDPKIIAGFQIEYGGLYSDESLQKKFEQSNESTDSITEKLVFA